MLQRSSSRVNDKVHLLLQRFQLSKETKWEGKSGTTVTRQSGRSGSLLLWVPEDTGKCDLRASEERVRIGPSICGSKILLFLLVLFLAAAVLHSLPAR